MPKGKQWDSKPNINFNLECPRSKWKRFVSMKPSRFTRIQDFLVHIIDRIGKGEIKIE